MQKAENVRCLLQYLCVLLWHKNVLFLSLFLLSVYLAANVLVESFEVRHTEICNPLQWYFHTHVQKP